MKDDFQFFIHHPSRPFSRFLPEVAVDAEVMEDVSIIKFEGVSGFKSRRNNGNGRNDLHNPVSINIVPTCFQFFHKRVFPNASFID